MDFTEDFMNRVWYMSFCTKEEIDRILAPQTPADYLLMQRANIVADNPRYFRVYLRKAQTQATNWSFEKSFSTHHYDGVISNLSQKDGLKCKDITFGDLFSDDANGYAEYHEKWGRMIYLNECLQFFLKFSNLALLDFDTEIPDKIRLNALRIAIRTMMKKEAMDFFLDPRGQVSEEILRKIHEPIPYELQFIAGHEFAHHLCGHLDDKKVSRKAVLCLDGNEYIKTVYNTSQEQEFEADINSITRPCYSTKEYCNVLTGALLWFISLSIYETAQDVIAPSSPFGFKTHPTADERYENIYKSMHVPDDFNTDQIETALSRAKKFKEWLCEDIAVNIEVYEFYGSMYLDKPNTKWRGKELIDRVDY